MIISFNKITGDIYGTISGRVHDENQIKNFSLRPSSIPEDQVEKYIAPTQTIYRMEPVEELRADRSGLVRRVITNKRVKKACGVEFIGPNAELIDAFDRGIEKITNYLLQHDEKGDYIFTKKSL